MISLDFQNLFRMSNGLSLSDFQAYESQLKSMQSSFLEKNQGFYSVLDDESVLSEIELFSSSVQGKYKDIVVLGIGGSALGTKAIRDAFFFREKQPQLHVLENIDPHYLLQKQDQWIPEKTLFLVVSKSGNTTETMSQYFYFSQWIRDKKCNPKNHFVCITGKESVLYKEAQKQDFPIFLVPKNVGGRFSVLTPVGLLPSALLGVDIRKLMKGARIVRDQFLSLDFEENTSFQLAVIQYLLVQKNYTNHVLMPYGNQLRTLSDWFVQLLAESTGKINTQGTPVGITPLPALGATDQHSQLQLFAQGPAQFFVLFLHITSFERDVLIPVHDSFQDSFSFLNNVSFGQLLNTEYLATADSLTESGCPNATLHIDSVSEETIGALFFLFSGTTAFLGELLAVNAFDQPGVERSKVLTKAYLSARVE